MTKCASAHTYEIDDPEAACAEIKAQLDSKLSLLKNSVGIVACHTEYIGSGALRRICESLPFEVVGFTTAVQAVDGEYGELILTLFVITSDDSWFVTGTTGDLEAGIEGPIDSAVARAVAGAGAPPKLALLFPPLILKYSGDTYVEAFGKALPNVPLFGPLAIDDSMSFDQAETVFRGGTARSSMPFVLCYGAISPRFIVGTFPDGKSMPYKGEITKSCGSVVSEINGVNAYKYFEGIGFTANGDLADSFKLVPFSIDQRRRGDYDGIPVIRGVAFFAEDGSAVFRGDVDEGSVFSLLTSESSDVLSATGKAVEGLNAMPDVNGALIFPCIGRRIMTISEHPLVELETVAKTIDPGIPYMIGYAGGEICPTLMKGGVPTNRYHNYSVVILVI
ncbi:MAG: FIST C-terminal domain-containing protein [Oscillospiraceae bacterium]|nr:FIST C-terminal domain-containing protein [Oscillospiraceae bacterium]